MLLMLLSSANSPELAEEMCNSVWFYLTWPFNLTMGKQGMLILRSKSLKRDMVQPSDFAVNLSSDMAFISHDI